MTCSKCGAALTNTSGFCPSCGQPIVGFSVGQANPAVAATPIGPGPVGAFPAYAGAQAPVAASSVGYAGFWLRLVAWFIDAILLGVVGNILMLIFGLGTGDWRHLVMSGGQPRPEDIALLMGMMFRIMFISIILHWLYYAFLESSTWQGTLGKKALGLYVTDLSGMRISFGRATGRFFARIISGLTLGIGYLMVAFTEKKQALHDMIAGTLVLRRL
jgi:uncharacterized RDD family membrane protein YckC